MSTLYIRHPAKASVDAADSALPCQFALVNDNGQIQREGSSTLANLAGSIADCARVVLVLAAADVCLWRVKLPALPAAKLKMALPNLLEEQMLSSPAESIVLATPGPAGADGLHAVAIVQKSWLESLQQQLRTLGARKISALPAQLCVEVGDTPIAVIEQHQDHCADLTLCRQDAPSLGLPLWLNQPGTLVQEVIQALHSLLPNQEKLQLIVAANQLQAFQQGAGAGIEVQADSWPRWVAGAKHCKLDLMTGVAGGSGGVIDWARWRWPMVLLILIAMVHIASINFEWLMEKKKAAGIKREMVHAFQTAFPKDPLGTDLVVQTRQKINQAKLASGQAAPDDFTALAAAFGEALNSVSQGRKIATLASMDYKERSLTIKWKDDGELPLKEMQSAMQARRFTLTESAPKVWQIKLGK